MKGKEHFIQLFHALLIIFETLQGINQKLWEFYTKNLKFQLKKLGRTRDILSFLTQGCSRIKFYTIF